VALIIVALAALGLRREPSPKTTARVRFDRLITNKLPNELLIYALLEDEGGNAINEPLSASAFQLRVDSRAIHALQTLQRVDTTATTPDKSVLRIYPWEEPQEEPSGEPVKETMKVSDTALTSGKPRIAAEFLSAVPVVYQIILTMTGNADPDTAAGKAQIDALCEFVRNMRNEDKVLVVITTKYTANTDFNVIEMGQQPKPEDVRQVIIDKITQFTLETEPPALRWSIDELTKSAPQPTERQALIVLSDGLYDPQWFTHYGLEQFAEEKNIPVYVITFNSGAEVPSGQLYKLEELARVSGGAYRVAKEVQDIPHELRLIQSKIANPYIIKLDILNTWDIKTDGMAHDFELTLNSERYTGTSIRKLLIEPAPSTLSIIQSVVFIAAPVALLIIVALMALYIILMRKRGRRLMGISGKRCPDCHTLLKDSWDSCPFCKYVPGIRKYKKEEKKGK
jgi:hypothetical protein